MNTIEVLKSSTGRRILKYKGTKFYEISNSKETYYLNGIGQVFDSEEAIIKSIDKYLTPLPLKRFILLGRKPDGSTIQGAFNSPSLDFAVEQFIIRQKVPFVSIKLVTEKTL